MAYIYNNPYSNVYNRDQNDNPATPGYKIRQTEESDLNTYGYRPYGVNQDTGKFNVPSFFQAGSEVPSAYYQSFINNAQFNQQDFVNRLDQLKRINQLHDTAFGASPTVAQQRYAQNLAGAQQSAQANTQRSMGGRYNQALARYGREQVAQLPSQMMAQTRLQSEAERQQALANYYNAAQAIRQQDVTSRAQQAQAAQQWAQIGSQAQQYRQAAMQDWGQQGVQNYLAYRGALDAQAQADREKINSYIQGGLGLAQQGANIYSIWNRNKGS